MKQKIVKILSLFFLIGLFSCQEEAIFENDFRIKELKISQKSFQELIIDSKFNTAYAKTFKNEINKSNFSSGKTVMENQYGFTITDKPVNVIEKDSLTSYTIFIERDNQNPNEYENLIVQIDNHNTTHAVIVKYIPDVVQFVPVNHDNYFKGKTIITPINFNSNNSRASFTICTTIVTTAPCPLHPRNSSGEIANGCGGPVIKTNTICTEVPEGDVAGANGEPVYIHPYDPIYTNNSPDPTNGLYGTYGSNNQNNSNQLNWGPMLTLPIEYSLLEPIQTPCQKLNSTKSKQIANVTPAKTVLTNLLDLKQNIATQRERMFAMSPTQNADGTINHNILTENYDQSPLGSDGVNSDFGGILIDIIVHTHWDTQNHLSIFSLSDIYDIYQKIATGQIKTENKTNFTAMVITAQGTQYAMSFSNITAFVTWGDNYFNGWNNPNQAINDLFRDKKQDAFYKDTEIALGNTPQQILNNEKG